MEKTKNKYEVVAYYSDGHRAGHLANSRLGILWAWRRDTTMAMGDVLTFKFYRNGQLIPVQ